MTTRKRKSGRTTNIQNKSSKSGRKSTVPRVNVIDDKGRPEHATPVGDHGSRVPRVRTPFDASIERGSEIGAPLKDPDYEPSNTRLRSLGITSELHLGIAAGELTSMGSTFMAEGGGSLRTFSGGLAHECGWWPGWKAARLQHWEGIAALHFIIEAETNPDVAWLQSEGIAFHFYLAPKWYDYTADAVMDVNGVRHVIEIKRSDADLADAEYRMKLAAVAEICRRCNWVFRVVFAAEIYLNRLHRQNCRLFADRRFVHVDRRRIDALETFAMHNGPFASYGDLAGVLAPGAVPVGEAIIQALTIRGRLEIDLTSQIYHRTPVRIL